MREFSQVFHEFSYLRGKLCYYWDILNILVVAESGRASISFSHFLPFSL